jgi:hypothetical protein
MAPIKAWQHNADYLDGMTAAEFATAGHDHAATYAPIAHEHDGAVTLGGDAANHVAIAADGTLTLVGTAKTWDDLRIEPVARTTGTFAPTFEQWLTNGAGSRGVYLYSFDNAAANAEREVFFSAQMPHAWAGTAIKIHVHWVAETTAPTSKVRWGLEYSWAEPTTVFGNSTIIYADTDIDAATGTTAMRHTITPFAALTPTSAQDGLSSILICRLFRNSSDAADTYTGKAGLLYIDVHIEIDKLGSNEEYVA